jgi:hypothetical protein
MRNPNEVTTIFRTTSTEFVAIYTFVSERIALNALGDYRRTYADVSGSTVTLAKNTIIVTQPIVRD